MSYLPAILEYAGWGIPYVFMLLVIWLGWRSIIGLRGEQVRSICVITMIFVLAYSLGQFAEAGAPWRDPHWLLAIVSMVTIALISWDAQRAKLRFAQFEAELGRKSVVDPNNADNNQDD